MITSPRLAPLLLALIGSGPCGCSVVGPAAIVNGRSVYNDAIVATNNEQVLAMIVHMRYEEPHGLLAVSSVTANIRVQASAGAEFGIGPESNFEGNLTPLAAGFTYEENPTISYSPVQGERYLRQLLSPIPIDVTLLLLGALNDSPGAMALLVKSINGVQNPAFLAAPSFSGDPRFARIAELIGALGRSGRLTWAQEPGEPSSSAMVLVGGMGDGEEYALQVRELYELLGLGTPSHLDDVVSMPVFLGTGPVGTMAIQLSTRSVYDLFTIAAASVEIPEEHIESGLAPRLPPRGPAGAAMRISRSKDAPKEAMTAVRHHGWWYSIDGTDTATKRMFRLLEALISVRIADSVDPHRSTPVLTVPVSR